MPPESILVAPWEIQIAPIKVDIPRELPMASSTLAAKAALFKIRRVTELRYVERFPAADKPGPAGQA